MNLVKGILVGISTVVFSAVAIAIAVDGGLETRSALFFLRIGTAMEAGWTALLFGLPPGVLFGWMLGTMSGVDGLHRHLRAAIFVVVALLGVGLCLPFWPDLAPYAVPITFVHALALARWTARPERFPRAIALRLR